jgi:CheY-like chemotaxis protein
VHVLVIDDNHDAADSLAMVLGALGASVDVAYNGADGLAAFERHRATMVLLDIGMPGMNGYDVARAIRSRWPERDATLVAVTGWGQADDRQRARDAGFDHHLVKPADIDVLIGLMAAVDAEVDAKGKAEVAS